MNKQYDEKARDSLQHDSEPNPGNLSCAGCMAVVYAEVDIFGAGAVMHFAIDGQVVFRGTSLTQARLKLRTLFLVPGLQGGSRHWQVSSSGSRRVEG